MSEGECESITATEIPETEAESLDTGLLDQWGKPILRPRTRIKLGFDLNPQQRPSE